MNISLYLCALTVSGLGYARRTGKDPLSIIAATLPDICLNQTSVDRGAVLLGEAWDSGTLSYTEWMRMLIQLPDTSLSVWEDPQQDHVGLVCNEKDLAWRFLYVRSPRLAITADRFLEFTDHQTDPRTFRNIVLDSVSEYSVNNFGQKVMDQDLEDFLHSPEGPIFFDYNGDTLLYDLAERYPEKDGIRVGKSFDPFVYAWDDPDMKHGKRYAFVETDTRTTTMTFQRFPDSTPKTPTRPDAVREQFRKGLESMTDVARKIRSPFYDAFTASRSILDLSEKGLRLDELVNRCETSPQGRQIIQRQSGIFKGFESLGSDATTTGRLFAMDIADVFGGMGSWNDQQIPPEHYDAYHRESRLFASALQEFRSSVVSAMD